MYTSRFLDLGTVGGKWLALLSGRFTLGEKVPGTHWIGGWVGPRIGLDDVQKGKFFTLPELELRPLSLSMHVTLYIDWIQRAQNTEQC
jgi:hypothetical protein